MNLPIEALKNLRKIMKDKQSHTTDATPSEGGRPNFTVYHWINRTNSKWVYDPTITKEVYAKRADMLAKELAKVPQLDSYNVADEYKLNVIALKVERSIPSNPQSKYNCGASKLNCEAYKSKSETEIERLKAMTVEERDKYLDEMFGK